MKYLCLAVFFLGVGCDSTPNDEVKSKNLTSAEVTQLAFTSSGKNLVVVNEVRSHHSRLRSFSTSDWKATGDTKELSLADIRVAPCAAETWMVQASDWDSSSRGNPYNGPVYYQLDPVTVARKAVDVIQKGANNRSFFPAEMACAGKNPLCVVRIVRLGSSGGPPSPPPFVFDRKAGKKTVELQDFPTGQLARGDFARSALEFAPDGKHVASAQPFKPYQIQLHDVNTGKLLKSAKINSPVGALQFSPNGKLLAAMCQDGTLLVLQSDLSTQMFARQFAGYGVFPKQPIAFVADSHLAVLSSSTTVDLLDTKEWKSVRTFEMEKNRVNCVAGSPEGKFVAVGCGDTHNYPGFVRIWETGTGKLVKELK